jgi:nucleoside-diphosphate kinase
VAKPKDIEQTLVLFKNDAVRRRLIGECLRRFERRGLRVVGIKSVFPDDATLAEHYELHTGKPYFAKIMETMTAQHIVACVLEGPGAIKGARALAGPCFDAPAGTIRGDLGLNRNIDNLVHTSDSPEAAENEIAIWFSTDEIEGDEGVELTTRYENRHN